jgi:hypothetical protein
VAEVMVQQKVASAYLWQMKPNDSSGKGLLK